ncbi:hypothetical protein GOP47_0029059 [Adiantum capillus-veneris]|nr:hypothetical protein GOP47_0029059 [Adiantum capillus-veneris]
MKVQTGIVSYGIIGAGMMGREHLLNITALEGAAVVAIADPHLPSQEAALAVLPSLKVFSDHKALLESGTCDMLVVSTPNNTHAEIVLDILHHAKPHHVLIEKPLCINIDDCHKVLEAAKARPGVFVQEKNVVQNWNRFNSNTGGTLVEKCCHFFDLMNLITGATPVRVMASGSQDVNHIDENYNGKVPDIIDNAYVIVEYDDGVRGMLDLCMFAEGGNNEQEICVVGDIGKVEAFVPESFVRFGTRAGGRRGVQKYEVHDDRIKYEGLHHGSSFLEHLEFLAAVTSPGERPPIASLYEGMLSVAIGMAAQKSIETGKPVSLGDIPEKKACQ